jgi:hypothetical protein
VKFETITVTPEIAAEWLGKNTHNRSVSRTRVAAYASDMRAGRWQLTSEPIAFDVDGVLSNGQHRLLGVVASDTPVQFTVAWDAPKSQFEVIDQGSVRGAGQILGMDGIAGGNTVAAAVRIVLRYGRAPGVVWTTTSAHVTTSEVLEYLSTHDVPAIDRPLLNRRKLQFATPSVWAAFAHIVCEQSPNADSWDRFHEGVIGGIGLKQGDPRLALLNYTGARWGGGQSDLIACIFGWNHWLNGRNDVSFIRASRASLPMPKPI